MSWVFISIIIFTVLQAIACRTIKWFFLGFLVTLIARALFMGRLIGATVKVKSLMITEAFSAGMLLVFNIISKSGVNYIGLLLYLIISGLCCFIMFIDDTFYLYVTEDVKDNQED